MLEQVDRVQIAVHDLDRAAETFRDVFEAEHVRDDDLRTAGAQRRVMHAGRSEFELLTRSRSPRRAISFSSRRTRRRGCAW
jgi:hypothetical protein